VVSSQRSVVRPSAKRGGSGRAADGGLSSRSDGRYCQTAYDVQRNCAAPQRPGRAARTLARHAYERERWESHLGLRARVRVGVAPWP
jgi:hypothetical protein